MSKQLLVNAECAKLFNALIDTFKETAADVSPGSALVEELYQAAEAIDDLLEEFRFKLDQQAEKIDQQK